ncbi:hypothetical protein ACTXI4_07285 [Glutamicibacter ardleyensis]|uniref:hypothetical protein n=1 Tax=Glutamicibacter ardleyensis TaxID=225894 RepID=UPI003FD6910A
MTNDVLQSEWTPLPGSLPTDPQTDKIYLLPTRFAAGGDDQGSPLYTDAVRYVPKESRAAGIPVEFSLSGDNRKYLSEYAIDPVTLSIALMCVPVINDWLIKAVEIFLESRARKAGYTQDEAISMPLRVSIAKLDPVSGAVEGLELEGPGGAVVDAIKELKKHGN